MNDQQVWFTDRYGSRDPAGRIYPNESGRWTAHAHGCDSFPTFSTRKAARQYVLDMADLFERRYYTI